MKNKSKRIVFSVAAIVLVLAVASLFYIGDYYKAQGVSAYLTTGNRVRVLEVSTGLLFDGEGSEKALIFYPGAKVEEQAYAPLLRQIAENGVDCFLVRMPGRLAFLGVNKAQKIMESFSYSRWYLAGHSLGGAMAADFSATHGEEIAALFLLAAYPTKDLSEANFPVCCIYGSRDSVLNREKLEAGKRLMPPDFSEVVIEGGNHAGFASYGEQKGDTPATISAKEQCDLCAQAICERIE